MTAPKMKLGDAFSWSYKPNARDLYTIGSDGERERRVDPYWCKAQLAVVVKHGDRLVLADLYWGSRRIFHDLFLWGDGRYWNLSDLGDLELVYLGNLGDFERTYSDPRERYRAEDILDLVHPNGGERFVRKGATEDFGVQLRLAEKKLAKARRDVEYHEETIRRIRCKFHGCGECYGRTACWEAMVEVDDAVEYGECEVCGAAEGQQCSRWEPGDPTVTEELAGLVHAARSPGLV